MIKKASFRELQHYSLNDIRQFLNVSEEFADEIVLRLMRRNILKIRSDSTVIVAEELQSSDIAIGNIKVSDSDKRYVFDYVGLIEFAIGNTSIILNCFPKYIARQEESVKLKDMRLFVRTIERYNKAQQFTITLASEYEEQLQYNPLAIALFLLRDYWENGIYINSKEILEKNGDGEIDWDATIVDTIPLIRDGRPFYIDYFTTSTTTDDADYITRLHEYILTKCSEYLRTTTLDELFDIEAVDLYEGEKSDFGDNEYIEQRILKEINVQFVTHKQILLRAMYAWIHETKHSANEIALSLYGTNSFHKVWENVCADVFDSQLNTPIKDLPLNLLGKYADFPGTLLKLIPSPKWIKYSSKEEQFSEKTLIPDYISIFNSQSSSYFVIMDAKYYNIKLPPNLSGQPGVDDIDKQYLYQLAYKDFINVHNLIPINAFLCPGDIDQSYVSGEVEMPIFAGLGLTNIKVVILSAEHMLKAYLAGNKLNLQNELSDLFY